MSISNVIIKILRHILFLLVRCTTKDHPVYFTEQNLNEMSVINKITIRLQEQKTNKPIRNNFQTNK